MPRSWVAPTFPAPDEASSVAPPDSAFPAEAATGEAAWQCFIDRLPMLRVSGSRALVVAPHPDDETLACGGLMAELAARGTDVQVVAVTDGEASHPGRQGLGALRRGEQDRALGALGVAAAPIRLGLPDGHVADHTVALTDRLTGVAGGADLVVAPWRADGHTDHDASGAAAAEAAERTGTRLLAYPLWAWQWARPGDLAPLALARHDLSAGYLAQKLAALGCYHSQTSDVLGRVLLPEPVLARFRRPCEVFADDR
jgi:LmbE family N-acetylglucosaminyl deacetylase